ncbi:MAG: hypothetical protein AAGA60_07530 [Cyanobacteria bacterium P01_E01_bin.42]
MKTTLHRANTVEIGLAIGISLQLLLFGACESFAQTTAPNQTAPNQSIRLDIPHLALNSGEGSASNEKALPAEIVPAEIQGQSANFNKEEYQPPQNGKPKESRGTGTRYTRDSLGCFFEAL